MHKALGLQPLPLDSFPVATMLRAVDLTLRTPPHSKLPITDCQLHKLCLATLQLGRMGVIL